jgi:phenylpyruvate tautomerase PptA (4-oxalocrotonate tautomerase family)
MLPEVRDAGAAALRCSPDNIWVMFLAVRPGCYLQGEEPAALPQASTHPPVVIAKAQSGRSPEQRTAFVTAVAAAVGRGLSVPPENIWIHYQEMRPEDVWFQGRWAG